MAMYNEFSSHVGGQPHVELRRFEFDSERGPKLTHYAFRYPAKFHPPVVRKLLETYSSPGQVCLDPFNGSGTILIEAAVSGRHAIGCDVDPLAVFVSRAKTRRHNLELLRKSVESVLAAVRRSVDQDRAASRALIKDITDRQFKSRVSAEGLSLPAIPKLHHWFRRVVLVQLARIKSSIVDTDLPDEHREFLLLCFASIIRKVSNADPTPVSGLEVTAHMRKLEETGRSIDTLTIFESAVRSALDGAEAYTLAVPAGVEIRCELLDARTIEESAIQADLVITSPPYHNAVDYYRRHQLEMFWLDLTKNQTDRAQLVAGYIGRPRIARRNMTEASGKLPATAAYWDERIRQIDQRRADDFLHYFASMRRAISGMYKVLPPKAKAVFVVGNSRFDGEEIPTAKLFAELAGSEFGHIETFWYPVKNRYMSYKRRNGADINREFVLVFERT